MKVARVLEIVERIVQAQGDAGYHRMTEIVTGLPSCCPHDVQYHRERARGYRDGLAFMLATEGIDRSMIRPEDVVGVTPDHTRELRSHLRELEVKRLAL